MSVKGSSYHCQLLNAAKVSTHGGLGSLSCLLSVNNITLAALDKQCSLSVRNKEEDGRPELTYANT